MSLVISDLTLRSLPQFVTSHCERSYFGNSDSNQQVTSSFAFGRERVLGITLVVTVKACVAISVRLEIKTNSLETVVSPVTVMFAIDNLLESNREEGSILVLM